MTKKELIQEIRKKHLNILYEIPNKTIEVILGNYHDVIRDALKAGVSFPIGNIVVLKPVTKPARQCRNPRNGEMVNVPERKSIKVLVAAAMKRELNG